MCPQWNNPWGQPPQQPVILMVQPAQGKSPRQKFKFPRGSNMKNRNPLSEAIELLEEAQKLQKFGKETWGSNEKKEEKKGKQWSTLEVVLLSMAMGPLWILLYTVARLAAG